MMHIIENKIIPTYYENPQRWAELMRQAIRTSAAYFHSDRMVIEYYNRLYKPIAHGSGEDETKDIITSEQPNLNAWEFSNIK